MHSSTVTLLAFSSLAAASLDIGQLLSGLGPAPASDPRWTNWQAPGPNDGELSYLLRQNFTDQSQVRSACPGLNTLANHNFINHNGTSLTIPAIVTGLAAGMNMGADFSVFAGAGALLSVSNPLSGEFDLASINKHNVPIEHDASISRQDAYFGNQTTFYKPNFEEYMSHFSGDMTDVKSIGAAKYSRYNDSLARDPSFVYGAHEVLLSYGENALYTQVLGGGPSAEGARVDFIRMLFEQEKLPWELGWRPSANSITLLSLGKLLSEILSESPDPISETLHVTA